MSPATDPPGTVAVHRVRSILRDDGGSAVAEFVMVGALLTVLTLSVIQLGLALHIRNTVLDAASEGPVLRRSPIARSVRAWPAPAT